MSVLSNWKLTYKPGVTGETVIVNYDAELLEEPEFNMRIGNTVVPIRYGTPFIELTDADAFDLSVTLINYSATDALARQEMMRALIVRYQNLGKVPLRLEVRDLTSERYDFASVVFGNPRVRRLVDYGSEGAAAWSLALPIIAVGATRTTL